MNNRISLPNSNNLNQNNTLNNYPNSQLNFFPKNVNQNQYKINHNYDIICFQKCSNWTLNLSFISNKNKKIFSHNFYGIIENKNIYSFPNQQNILSNELSSYFPIDLKENQRFVLDKNQHKIPLLITFDFSLEMNNKNNEFFTKVTNDYSFNLFELDINAKLNETQKKMFKENINFRVKGYDILKAIKNKINDFSIESTNLLNQNLFSFETFVFKNIQCSFGIQFSIKKENLINYINNNDNNPFFNIDIQINKLFINYNLPFIVFKNVNLKGLNYVNNNYINPSINLIQNSCCNFYIFLMNTTPLINETNFLKINYFLKYFFKFSSNGVKCIFKINYSNFINVSYFPILNKIYLNIQKTNTNSSINNNNSISNYLSYLTSGNEKEKMINPQIIYIDENINSISNQLNYIEQINKIFKLHSEFDIIDLSNIDKDSYFSIIWVPNYKLNQNFPLISFEVFYQFKSGINNVHYLTILGIIEKNIFEIEQNKFSISNFDYFWFANLFLRQGISKNNKYTYINSDIFNEQIKQSIYMNKISYMRLKDKIINVLNSK